METVLSPREMYALERAYFEAGNDSLALMERAARCLTEELEALTGGLQGKTVAFLCGGGNNAGDGFASARFAQERGARSILVPLCDHWKGDAQTEYELARAANVPVCPLSQAPQPDAWVDAVFGIGLNRPLSEEYAPIFARLERDRQAGSRVLSVDLPSGIDGATGCVQTCAVKADLTVTFQCAKRGHFFADGPDYCGRLIVRDIGLGQAKGELARVTEADVRAAFPMRRRNSHKGIYGHLLLVAGSYGMAGAASLAANAALRSGCGLVSIACPRSIVPILQTLAPCAMCLPLEEQDGALSEAALPALREALSGKSAVAVGPGLSRRAAPRLLEEVLASGLPAVIDADALNLLSTSGALRSLLASHHLITPHPGEAARLVPGLSGDAVERAKRLRELGAAALYKGAVTVVAGESGCCLTTSGCSGMAKGGSGDVLTGMAGALLAQGVPAETAGWLASEVHGLAGEAAERRKGPYAMTALDQIDALCEVTQVLLS